MISPPQVSSGVLPVTMVLQVLSGVLGADSVTGTAAGTSATDLPSTVLLLSSQASLLSRSLFTFAYLLFISAGERRSP